MTTSQAIEIQTLAASLNPLIDHFNTHDDKLRILTVLSPMCPK